MFDFEKFPIYEKSEILYSKVLKILSNSKIEKLITEELFNNIYADLLEISKMLSGLINAMVKK